MLLLSGGCVGNYEENTGQVRLQDLTSLNITMMIRKGKNTC